MKAQLQAESDFQVNLKAELEIYYLIDWGHSTNEKP